jgi:hypothetical protein
VRSSSRSSSSPSAPSGSAISAASASTTACVRRSVERPLEAVADALVRGREQVSGSVCQRRGRGVAEALEQPAQQRVEAVATALLQRRREAGLGLLDRGRYAREPREPLRGGLQRVGAPVGRVATALEQAGGLEAIDDVDHDRAVDVEQLAELLLRLGAGGGEDGEHAELARLGVAGQLVARVVLRRDERRPQQVAGVAGQHGHHGRPLAGPACDLVGVVRLDWHMLLIINLPNDLLS